MGVYDEQQYSSDKKSILLSSTNCFTLNTKHANGAPVQHHGKKKREV